MAEFLKNIRKDAEKKGAVVVMQRDTEVLFLTKYILELEGYDVAAFNNSWKGDEESEYPGMVPTLLSPEFEAWLKAKGHDRISAYVVSYDNMEPPSPINEKFQQGMNMIRELMRYEYPDQDRLEEAQRLMDEGMAEIMKPATPEEIMHRRLGMTPPDQALTRTFLSVVKSELKDDAMLRAPVLLYSGADPVACKRMQQEGLVDDFLPKPSRPEQLVAKLSALISRSRSGGEADTTP